MKDWYRGNDALFRQHLVGVPGVMFDNPGYRFHRSVLPLLDNKIVAPTVKLDRQAWDAHCAALGFTMRPHQHDPRDFIRSRHGSLVADGLRTGKTVSVCSAHNPAEGPLVVICPLLVRRVWERWGRTIFPNAKIASLTGRTYEYEEYKDHDIIIMHYDIAYSWMSVGIRRRIGTLAIDEAHLLSNPKSHRTQAANMLAGNSERVVAITGTPLWNKPAGLYSILNIVTGGGFGDFRSYATRYCDGRDGTYGFEAKGSSNEEEFKQRLTEIMIRRTWDDISDSVPEISRETEVVDISRAQGRKIDIAYERVRTAGSLKLVISELAHYRNLLGEIKLDASVKHAQRILIENEPVVVWTWHRELAAKIAEKLKTDFVITGEVPDEKREEILNAWEKSTKALVITLGVGQAGIDLSHAKFCVFAEIDFTPAVIAQAEMRTFAPTRPMNVTYVVADHPVDKQLIEALALKCEHAYKMGTPAAESAVDVITDVFGGGGSSIADMDRLLETVLSDDTLDVDEE